MALVLALLVPVLVNDAVKVPAPLPFEIGVTKLTHGMLTEKDADGQKVTHQLTITETPKREAKSGDRTTILNIRVEGGGAHDFELTTTKLGKPISCKAVTKEEDGVGAHAALLFLRRPLWPSTATATQWTSTLSSPVGKKKALDISCKAELMQGMSIAISVEQKTPDIAIDAHQVMSVVSALTIEPFSGRTQFVHEEMAIKKDGKTLKTLIFDEHA